MLVLLIYCLEVAVEVQVVLALIALVEDLAILKEVQPMETYLLQMMYVYNKI